MHTESLRALDLEQAPACARVTIPIPNGAGRGYLFIMTEVRDDQISLAIDGVDFIFHNIICKTRQFDAELEVIRPRPLDPLASTMWADMEPFRFHIAANSLSNVTTYRRAIQNYYGDDLDWDRLIVRACKQAEAAYKAASYIEWPEHAPETVGQSFALDQLVPVNEVSCFFGMPEAAKSIAVQSMLHAMSTGYGWLNYPTIRTNALWVDWERPVVDNFALRRRRLIAGGHDVVPGSVGWMRGRGVALPEQTEAIKREMNRIHASVLVVDSVALACGGNAIDQEIANRFFNAVNSLKCTVILIAHTNRAEDDRMPFGSIFWNAGIHGRSWFLRRSTGQDPDVIDVGFYIKKVSDGRRPQDFALRLRFTGDDGPVVLEAGDLQAVNRENGRMTAKDKIRDYLLAEGKGTLAAIAAATKVDYAQVKTRIAEMAKNGEATKIGTEWAMAVRA